MKNLYLFWDGLRNQMNAYIEYKDFCITISKSALVIELKKKIQQLQLDYIKIIQYEWKNISKCCYDWYNQWGKEKCITLSNAFFGKLRWKKLYSI